MIRTRNILWAFCIFVSICLFFACGNSMSDTPLANVIESYSGIKNALFNDKVADAKVSAKEMIKAIDEFKTDKLKPKETEQWKVSNKHLKEHLAELESAKDIVEERLAFAELSEAMIETSKGFDTKGIFVLHCPMAKTKKGEGADWISSNETIQNPYYGCNNEMASCGEVKEELK